MTDTLDSFDMRILAIVQRDCQTRAEAIAEQVGLSVSAVQRRLKRLREDAVITHEIAVVDRARYGRPMTFIAGVEIERENYRALENFKRWLEEQDDIQQAYYVTGPVDVILIIIARDVETYDAITERVMEKNPQIRRMNTNVVLNTLKLGLALPAPDALS
jgi:Lrp/AsnC family leucine-responsive transcriptional regulator